MNKLCGEIETPYYVINECKLVNNYKNLEEALSKRWSHYQIGYSFKTNSLPWVINKLRNLGAYAEVVSQTEYELALKLGYEKKQVIFNGPHKGVDAIREVLEADGIVNIDSFHEIEWLKRNRPIQKECWEVGIRINFDLEKECPDETIMGINPGRFGFNVENGSFAKALLELNQLSYVKVVGIHGHHSTKTKSLKIFKSIAEKIVEVTQDIKKDIHYIDMGGCFFGDKPNAPSFNEYVDTITDVLEQVYDTKKVTLILEPGAALIASPVQYICRAIDKKDAGNTRFVGIDGSLMHIAPQLNNNRMFPKVYATGDKSIDYQMLAGYTCIEKDRIVVEGKEKEINIGDYIEFNNVGAYSMALSPLFIQYYPAVYVEQEDGMILVRDRWNVDDYINKCTW